MAYFFQADTLVSGSFNKEYCNKADVMIAQAKVPELIFITVVIKFKI